MNPVSKSFSLSRCSYNIYIIIYVKTFLYIFISVYSWKCTENAKYELQAQLFSLYDLQIYTNYCTSAQAGSVHTAQGILQQAK